MMSRLIRVLFFKMFSKFCGAHVSAATRHEMLETQTDKILIKKRFDKILINFVYVVFFTVHH